MMYLQLLSYFFCSRANANQNIVTVFANKKSGHFLVESNIYRGYIFAY